ncbi:hypothetical protein [Pseudonocardia sp. GCM10023141]
METNSNTTEAPRPAPAETATFWSACVEVVGWIVLGIVGALSS